jgi:hypothetical protein
MKHPNFIEAFCCKCGEVQCSTPTLLIEHKWAVDANGNYYCRKCGPFKWIDEAWGVIAKAAREVDRLDIKRTIMLSGAKQD